MVVMKVSNYFYRLLTPKTHPKAKGIFRYCKPYFYTKNKAMHH